MLCCTFKCQPWMDRLKSYQFPSSIDPLTSERWSVAGLGGGWVGRGGAEGAAECLFPEGSDVLAQLPRAVGAPSLEVLGAGLDGALGSLVCGRCGCMAEGCAANS